MILLFQLEDAFEREKKVRGDVEKAKRKVEGDLKMTQETVDDLERVKRDMEEMLRKKDGEINNLNGRLEDDASLISKLQKTIKELQVRFDWLFRCQFTYISLNNPLPYRRVLYSKVDCFPIYKI